MLAMERVMGRQRMPPSVPNPLLPSHHPCPLGKARQRLGQPRHCPLPFPSLSLGTRAEADPVSPHLSSGLLRHVVAIGRLQLLLLPCCPVLPSQIPHSPLVFELPLLMPAQLYIPKKELLISQLGLQVLKLLSLSLSQVFSAGFLPQLRDLGQDRQSKPHPAGTATPFLPYLSE